MKRRNFLAYLPSISAIPLIGADIISTPEKVEIIKPTPLEVSQINNSSTIFDFRKAVVNIEYEGKTISSGYLTSLTEEHPSVYGDEIIGFMEMGERRITIEAEMFNIVIPS